MCDSHDILPFTDDPILEVVPSLEGDLLAEGYRPGAPDHVTLDSRAVDDAACADMTCPDCGASSMQYRPYRRGTSYRVVAVCPRLCGGEVEL
jgi:hypothetical protein